MAFSADDFLALLNDTFPPDRRATFDDVAAFLQRVKQTLEAEQRQYVMDELQLESILLDKAVFEAESADRPWTDAEARERIAHWLAVYWPTPDDH